MIDINFEKANRQAANWSLCAEGIDVQSKKLISIGEDLRDTWPGGPTAVNYVKKLNELAEKLKADAERCSNDVAAFRARIYAIKAAEEEAKRAIDANDAFPEAGGL